MDLKSAFTGGLPIVLILSTVLTALVSVFLLWLYRRAVVRAMNLLAGVSETPGKFAAPAGKEKNETSFVISIIDSASHSETISATGSAYRQAVRSLNQSASVYIIGGLSYTLVLTAAWMITAGGGFFLTRFLWLFSCFCWPIIITVSLINPIIRKSVAIFYGAMVLIIAIITLVLNPDSSFGQLVLLWILINGSGTIMLLLFMNRRVRAVGPLVLTFFITAFTGVLVLLNLVGNNEGWINNIADIGSELNLGATMVLVMLIVIGFVLFGSLGWQLLRWFGHRYQKKRMSDQSITLDAIVLLFGIVQSFTLVFEGWLWIFTGLVAFAAYKIIVQLGNMFIAKQLGDTAMTGRLLLLRVFSLGHRSEKLFDMISRVWLRKGSISLIAGPDLATTTLEPHEFLNFMGGKLSRQFVSGESDLENRVLNLDIRPDPDGRHRVNEFFCRADTWQITMQRLAAESDAVLMDLRSFSKINQGCTFELQQLLNYVSLNRIVLIVDDSTDRIFLEETIKTLYQQLNPSSPNSQNKEGVVRLFTFKKKGFNEIKNLLVILFALQPESQSP